MLPAGPTAVDMVANALFFYGLLRVLVEAERPLWSYMSFDAAHENFTGAARNGMDATLYWPGTGWIQPGRAGAAQAAADGRRGPGPLGGRRRGVRPLPAGRSSSAA